MAAPVVEGGDNKKEDEEELKLNIHTANKWEQAQLGDNARKNKFLRLMGASRVSVLYVH